jgi:hypothetical protein
MGRMNVRMDRYSLGTTQQASARPMTGSGGELTLPA